MKPIKMKIIMDMDKVFKRRKKWLQPIPAKVCQKCKKAKFSFKTPP